MDSLGYIWLTIPIERVSSPREILTLLDKAAEAGMWSSSAIQGVLARDGKLVPID